MSHMAKNKIQGLDTKKIKYSMVKKALKMMAKHKILDVKIENHVHNWNGEEIKAKGIAVSVNNDRFHMDFQPNDKEVIIYTDDYCEHMKSNSQFMKEFKKAYTCVTMQKALQSEGLFCNVKPKLFGNGSHKKANYNIVAEG
jgi:hypothetical protein